MVTCPGCDRDLEADELTRHEFPGLLVVHCPDCGRFIGQYRRHGQGVPRS